MRSSAVAGWDQENQRNQRALHSPQQSQRQIGGTNVHAAERWLSVAGGSVLVLYGLKRRSLRGLALALLGGDLIYRGVTGHCHVYKALGISTTKGMKTAPQKIREDAPSGYELFNKREDRCIKVVLKPEGQ